MEKKVGNRIRERRKRMGWTQEELSKRVNVSPQVVSNWERSYSIPDSFAIQSLAEALKVSADYLLCRSDDPNGSASSEDALKLPEVQFIMRAKEKMSPKAYEKFLKLMEEAQKAFDDDDDDD